MFLMRDSKQQWCNYTTQKIKLTYPSRTNSYASQQAIFNVYSRPFSSNACSFPATNPMCRCFLISLCIRVVESALIYNSHIIFVYRCACLCFLSLLKKILCSFSELCWIYTERRGFPPIEWESESKREKNRKKN